MASKKKTAKKRRVTKKAAANARSAKSEPAEKGSGESQAGKEKVSKEFVVFLDDPEPSAEQASEPAASDPGPGQLLQNISTKTDGAQQMLLLPTVCRSQDVATVKPQLLALRQDGQPITIDARDVEEVDSAFLQLLCAFALDAARNHVEVQWQCDDGLFFEAVANLGLSEHFQCI